MFLSYHFIIIVLWFYLFFIIHHPVPLLIFVFKFILIYFSLIIHYPDMVLLLTFLFQWSINLANVVSKYLVDSTYAYGFSPTRQLLEPSLREYWEIRDHLSTNDGVYGLRRQNNHTSITAKTSTWVPTLSTSRYIWHEVTSECRECQQESQTLVLHAADVTKTPLHRVLKH